jgi:hypothetical protein
MWAKNMFLNLYFFIPGPFQGGHFLGGIIHFSALHLKPAFLNLRPAHIIYIVARGAVFLCEWVIFLGECVNINSANEIAVVT